MEPIDAIERYMVDASQVLCLDLVERADIYDRACRRPPGDAVEAIPDWLSKPNQYWQSWQSWRHIGGTIFQYPYLDNFDNLLFASTS